MMKSIWIDRLPSMKEALTNGTTLDELGALYGVSRQRMQQVVSKFFPTLKKSEFGAGARRLNRINIRQAEIKKVYNRDSYQDLSDLERAQSAFFTRKKQNCKYRKWEWDIYMSDLTWPTHCPILGLELDWFADRTKENSPSIDRLDSSKGYIKGNVAVMSWRANRIKNDGLKEEHQLIADYLSKMGL